ncbi:hypothetical protein E4K67_12220 [Desulfosporosinus fructosivorans]|uniref:Uncharacterized protein n=1 Tax=Desulfosporosinus fructosivorans TaxID=2018669 RepID=A0A4Z0R398_9FIRM|nr:hypothetical protein [Desulfosporosinus fructosivorans]TGE37512.1 hypothetical protein E4K67_12220 [Desulfosporosinus fructosivorans]
MDSNSNDYCDFLYCIYTGSYYLILKLCKIHHLMLKKKHPTKGITKADLPAQANANLIKEDFTAELPIKNGLEILKFVLRI